MLFDGLHLRPRLTWYQLSFRVVQGFRPSRRCRVVTFLILCYDLRVCIELCYSARLSEAACFHPRALTCL